MLAACPLLLILATSTCAPPGRPVVNEVLYDAPGDDTGWEFVELFNPGPAAIPLAGARLEAGDGSTPGRWTLRWTGGAGDTIRSLARFVVGGARVTPAPDAVVTLDLQNGPDALRMTWPDGAFEVVGWGPHEFAEFACGEPAPDVAGGLALARVPDGGQSGSNLTDFRAADPTPGRPNQPGRDLAVVRGSLALDPERPGANAPAILRARVAHRGREPLAAGEAVVHASAEAWAEPRLAPLGALAPGDTADVALDGTLPAGAWSVVLRVAVAGDEAAGNDSDTLRAGAGESPVQLSEIQFHPAGGEGEWLELRGIGPGAFGLAGLAITDRGGTRARVGDASPLDPDSFVVLAQDPAAWLARHPSLDARRVIGVSPWPSLNNSDDTSGTADAIELRAADGVLLERVAYSARGVTPGVPLERDQGVWRMASGPEGTPLAPPVAPARVAGRFRVSPARVRPGTEVRAIWDLPWPRADVSVSLWDLSGRPVSDVAPERLVPGRGSRALSLTGVRPGVYVAVLRARAADGTRWSRSSVLQIDGVEP